jgi:hypothetical protein
VYVRMRPIPVRGQKQPMTTSDGKPTRCDEPQDSRNQDLSTTEPTWEARCLTAGCRQNPRLPTGTSPSTPKALDRYEDQNCGYGTSGLACARTQSCRPLLAEQLPIPRRTRPSERTAEQSLEGQSPVTPYPAAFCYRSPRLADLALLLPLLSSEECRSINASFFLA